MSRVALLDQGVPPEVYGGAGVHVEYLARHLAGLVDVGVYCFGAPRQDALVAGAYEPWEALAKDGKGTACAALSVDLRMAGDVAGADLVHSHTWYANFAGYLARVLYRVPHVMTSTAWSRCDRGRRSSWAPATACRAGSNALPSRAPTP